MLIVSVRRPTAEIDPCMLDERVLNLSSVLPGTSPSNRTVNCAA